MDIRNFGARIMRVAGLAVVLTTAALGLAQAAGGNAAPGATVESAKAEVSYRDASKLSEVSSNPGNRTDWLDTLSRYVATSADKALPSGERLVVRIDDVQLAGIYLPGRRVGWDQIRVVRDTTPPRIDLNFRLESAQGEVLKQGDRKLRNLNFLYTNSLRHQGDTLSYEKNLIDDWMAKEFAAPR